MLRTIPMMTLDVVTFMRKEHDSRPLPMLFVEKSRNRIIGRQINKALLFVFRCSCTNRTDNSKSYRFRRTCGKA